MASGFSPITHLRHVGLAVPNYDQAVEFYTKVWGLTPIADDSGVTFFGSPADPEHYILRLREDRQKRLDLVSFGAESIGEVDLLAERLGRAGVTMNREPSVMTTPGGGYGLRFFDVDGRLIEVSADVEQRPFRLLEERESIPRKLSHVVINSTDVQRTKAFYEKHLGFRLSDWLGDLMCFMRSSSQHHILAISQAPSTSLNHISFEMRGIDEYMRGTGRMIRSGYRPLWGPGRHGAGDNTFSYFLDPLDNVIEYTTELETVDENTWEPSVYDPTRSDTQDQWGTGGAMTEVMLPVMLKQRDDVGLWVPSPI
ncbi:MULTISPECIES: VOC family protein [unclassified Rhodococcus (in: high G+C Gram-positive bacteria)]|uniref:VOC family protein n=1 Tax=unclassified Rhodococcus (in: high G+C Gram-positive bacteria) TaxID=192944 RepID=UPI0006F41929|nr:MULTISPECIES: VOC family protein [unclassified Rhodococcus (in: high G+C Gram-positive bacteria)]KQU29419.1 oxidoreductase [Rhodococcus sp. Leaf225]KQU41119.1 oxidoreductase [Rhodococcus sp. Leaf258]